MMPRAWSMAAALVHLALTHCAEAEVGREDRSSAARAPPYTNLMGHSLPDMGRMHEPVADPIAEYPYWTNPPGSSGLTTRHAGWQRSVRGTSPTSSPTTRPADRVRHYRVPRNDLPSLGATTTALHGPPFRHRDGLPDSPELRARLCLGRGLAERSGRGVARALPAGRRDARGLDGARHSHLGLG